MPPKRAKTATIAAPAPATRSTRSTRAAATTFPAPAKVEKTKTKTTKPAKSKSNAKSNVQDVEADVEVEMEVEVPSSVKRMQLRGGSEEEARTKADRATQEEEYRMVDEVLLDVENIGEKVEAADPQETLEAEPVEAQEPDRTPKPVPRTRQTRLGARLPRTVKKVVQSEANRKALEGLKKRMEEDARRLRGSPDPQSDVEEPAPERRSITPPAAPATVQRAAAVPGTAARAPQSALKVQSTPGVENSILALANFRRRPRQPSLLQMVQGKGLDVDPEDDTTDFTLGTDLEDSVEGLEGFKPYDESTPLQVSKTHVLPQAHATPEPEAQPDAEDEDDLYGATPLQSPSRKRKSDALETDNEATQIQVRRSVSPSRHSSPELPQDPLDDFETIPATHPSSSMSAYPEEEPQDPMSDTLADPLSSSPPPYPSRTPQIVHPHPPTSPQTRKAAARNDKDPRKPKPLTTATLRAMLPKRRVRRLPREDREDFSIPSSSSLEERERSSPHHEDSGARKKPSGKKRPGALSPNASRKTQAATKKSPKGIKKTYTRLSGADKENTTAAAVVVLGSSSPLSSAPLTGSDAEEDETADTSLETIGRNTTTAGKRVVSRELQAAKSKFDEVDDWEMEFESASVGVGAESSPWR